MYWLLWSLMPPCVVLLMGASYQVIGTFRDRRSITEHGVLIDIGSGRRMFVSEAGSGGPTVIFESGITASSLHWADLQAEVSAVARTFAYDRLGLGWSSDCISERTPSNLVLELRTVLQKAGVKPPYVFVAHSFGGLIARRFASEYAEDVAGLVLLDPMPVEEWELSNEFRQKMLERGVQLMERAAPLARVGFIRLAAKSLLRHSEFFSHVLGGTVGKGSHRMIARTTRELHKMPARLRPHVVAQWSTPGFYRGAAAYFRAVPASVREMQLASPASGIPILVLHPESTCSLSGKCLRSIGPHANQRGVEKSGHWIHLDRPDVVLDAIYTMLHTTSQATLAEKHQEALVT